MVVIFNFSSKTSDESSAQSNAAGMFVGEMMVPGFEEWPEAQQQEFADKWDYRFISILFLEERAGCMTLASEML